MGIGFLKLFLHPFMVSLSKQLLKIHKMAQIRLIRKFVRLFIQANSLALLPKLPF